MGFPLVARLEPPTQRPRIRQWSELLRCLVAVFHDLKRKGSERPAVRKELAVSLAPVFRASIGHDIRRVFPQVLNHVRDQQLSLPFREVGPVVVDRQPAQDHRQVLIVLRCRLAHTLR